MLFSNSLPVVQGWQDCTECMLARAEQKAIDVWLVPNSLLPDRYHGKKSHRKLRSVVKQSMRRRKTPWVEGREVSVKFDKNRNIIPEQSRSERIAIIEQYRADLEVGEIEYKVAGKKMIEKGLDYLG